MKKFSKNLTFLTSWYAHVRVRIRGLEMLVFQNILRTYLMDGPYLLFIETRSKETQSVHNKKAYMYNSHTCIITKKNPNFLYTVWLFEVLVAYRISKNSGWFQEKNGNCWNFNHESLMLCIKIWIFPKT